MVVYDIRTREQVVEVSAEDQFLADVAELLALTTE